jgi:hypothetical protein
MQLPRRPAKWLPERWKRTRWRRAASTNAAVFDEQEAPQPWEVPPAA